MATSKNNEKFFIGIDDEIVELTGVDKEAFIAQRAKEQAEAHARKAEADVQKELKISAYKKLGLTDDEIQAII